MRWTKYSVDCEVIGVDARSCNDHQMVAFDELEIGTRNKTGRAIAVEAHEEIAKGFRPGDVYTLTFERQIPGE